MKVHGSQINPITREAICARVSHYPEGVHGPDRLQTPLLRTGPKGEGQFTRLTWDEALDIIDSRFTAIQQYGPEAIGPLHYAGPHGLLAGGSMDLRFFHTLGASHLARRPLCGGVKSEASMGTYEAVPLMGSEHVADARLIMVWGSNPRSRRCPWCRSSGQPASTAPGWRSLTRAAHPSPGRPTCT